MSRTLLRSLFSFDPRPTSEVEDEMRAEFDAHLAMLEDELAQQGLDPVTARAQALARFGDPTRLSREGKAIKLGDRIMLQRINLALLIVIGAAVIFLLVQNQRISSRSVATLEQVTASLAAIQNQSASTESSVGPSSRRVFIEGEVEKPGTYILPARGMSVNGLITAAGGLKGAARTVYYDKAGSTEDDRVLSTSDRDSLRTIFMGVNDIVTVSAEADSRAPATVQVEVRGYVGNLGKRRINADEANLMTLLNIAVPEAEAMTVRIERAGPEPTVTTLSIGEARAEIGRNTPILAGDVVTVLGASGEVEEKKGWENYEPTPRVAKLLAGDRVLFSLVEDRRRFDQAAQQRLKAGYPLGHRELRSMKVRAEECEYQIASRLRELLKPEIDAAAENDVQLKDLLNQRAQFEHEWVGTRANSMGADRWAELRRKGADIDSQIIARFEELSPSEKK